MKYAATFVVLANLLFTSTLWADDAAQDDAAKAESASNEVSLDGVFAADRTHSVSVPREGFSGSVIASIAPHGKQVKKGGVLVRFERRAYDEALHDMELEHESTKLGLRKSLDAQKRLALSTKQQLASGRRTLRVAEENLQVFLGRGRDRLVKDQEIAVENARNFLGYAREELEQLKKMYLDDDLTEETEEIIFQRAQNRAKGAEYGLEKAESKQELFLKYDLPRQEIALRDALIAAQLAWDTTQKMAPISLRLNEIEVEQLQDQLKRTGRKLAKLRKAGNALELKAPADGIVYYGEATDGKWGDATKLAAAMKKGSAAAPGKVLLTVVEPQKLSIRAMVAEADLHRVRVGSQVTVTPTAFPSLKLMARVKSLSDVPTAPGKFAAVLAVEMPEGKSRLRAGMACKAVVAAK